MSINNTNVYSFKSASSRLSNYKKYGSDKYTANYKIYGNTIDGSSVSDLKNLANPNDLQQGYYEYTDGSSVLGNLKWVCTQKIPCKSNTNYTFSFKNPSRWAGFVWYDSSDTYISTSNRSSGFTNGGYYTAKSPSNAAYFVVNIAGYPDDNASITVDNIIDLMIEEGSTPSEYEPYGYKVPIRITGKNLIDSDKAFNTHINGLTATINSDKSITVNGTANSTTFIRIPFNLNSGSYIINGCPENGSNTSYLVTIRNIDGSYAIGTANDDTGNGINVNFPNGLTHVRYSIRIASGYTCDNLTFYPMIRKADIEDDTYEPYREEIHNVYLESPLTKSGDNCDYIDFKEQKRVNINGTEEYIKLPEFNISENSSIFIDTDTQPSNIDFDISHGVGDGGYSYNILPMSLTPKTETHGDFLCEYDGLGTIKLTTIKNNASTTTDFIIPLEKPITFPQSISQGGTGCFQLNNTSDKYPNSSSDGRLYFYNDNTCIASWPIYIYQASD